MKRILDKFSGILKKLQVIVMQITQKWFDSNLVCDSIKSIVYLLHTFLNNHDRYQARIKDSGGPGPERKWLTLGGTNALHRILAKR